MPTNKLTKELISALKKKSKESGKTLRLADGGGLYLQAEPRGLYWRMSYRVFDAAPKAGDPRVVQKTLSFGVWPEVDLLTARKKRDAAKDELRAGRDPGETWKGTSKPRIGGQTFGAIAAELLVKMEREGAAPATLKKNRWLLETLAAPIKDEAIRDLKASDIQTLLATIEASERFESAIRLRGAIGSVFNYAIQTARADAPSPTLALAGGLTSPPVKNYPAVINTRRNPRAVGRLLLAIDSFPGSKIVRLALQFAPLVFVRPGELRSMQWDELYRRKNEWIIPKEKTKERREHIVPLAPQALAILDEARKISGDSDFVFPNLRTPSKCLSEGTLGSALAQIGYPKSVHTPHGFRSTASTCIHGSGLFDHDLVEIQLAHRSGDRTRAIYDRGEYMETRVQIMKWWANECDRLRAKARRRSVADLLGPEPG